MSDSNKVLAGVGAVTIGVTIGTALLLYHCAVDGFVLSRLWLWFAVRPYHLPTIGWQQFSALVVGVALLKVKQREVDVGDDGDASAAKRVAQRLAVLIMPWMVLFVGWVFS